METQNSTLVEPATGLVTVLGLIGLHLNGPFRWQSEDINDDRGVGTIFRAYDRDPQPGDLDLASVTVVDVTNDPNEPDISNLDCAGIMAFDNHLRENMVAHQKTEGIELVRWMSSRLDVSENRRGLITAYIVNDKGKARQFITLRVNVNGHKIVAIGVFDISMSNILATPIIDTLRSIGLAP